MREYRHPTHGPVYRHIRLATLRPWLPVVLAVGAQLERLAIVPAVVGRGSTSPVRSARAVVASSDRRTGRKEVSSTLTFRWYLEHRAIARAAVPWRCPCTFSALTGATSSGSCLSSSDGSVSQTSVGRLLDDRAEHLAG